MYSKNPNQFEVVEVGKIRVIDAPSVSVLRARPIQTDHLAKGR